MSLHVNSKFAPPFKVYVIKLARDNRCLKPNDSKDPETWDHYDPDDFYEATSEEFIIFNL